MSQHQSLAQAVIVHGTADVDRACAPGLKVTLLSASGAAIFAGPGWWLSLIRLAHARHGALIAADILDCADAPGLALAALRLGQMSLILDPACLAFPSVAAAAVTLGAHLRTIRPAALDLAEKNADRRLAAWLSQGDSAPPLR